jgi:hypothetical protein
MCFTGRKILERALLKWLREIFGVITQDKIINKEIIERLNIKLYVNKVNNIKLIGKTRRKNDKH